tara:strand:+ start:94 stop:264 length:171 start_codon:yes stop_codon:yes gene_type:complete
MINKSKHFLNEYLREIAKSKYDVNFLYDLNEDQLDHIFHIAEQMLIRSKNRWTTPH